MRTYSAVSNFCLEQPWFVFNATQRYRVAKSFDPRISHFYSFVVDRPDAKALAIPDGCVDIIFDCDSTNPSARVCGTPARVREFDLQQGHKYFGVRFCSGYTPSFLTVSASELRDHEFELSHTMSGAEELLELMVNHQSFNELYTGVARYLGGCLRLPAGGLTNCLLTMIKQHRGSLAMSDLEERFSCTGRTIQRQFKEDTGMSPKSFSRIVRCQEALKLLDKRDSTALDIALELGFSDQSHFQREFKELVSITPLDYIKRANASEYLACIEYAADNRSPSGTVTVQ